MIEKKEVSLLKVKVALLEAQIEHLKLKSRETKARIDFDGLDPILEHVSTHILSKLNESVEEETQCDKSEIKIYKDALFIAGVPVSEIVKMTSEVKYGIGRRIEVVLRCFPDELLMYKSNAPKGADNAN